MNTCCTPSAPASQAQAPTQAEKPLRKPRYSMSGNDEAFVIAVELPGVVKDAIGIDLDKGILSIRGDRKNLAPETWKPLYRELNDIGYALRLKLNAPVDEDKLSAQFADGVLTLTLPLRATAKPRRIEVN